jgi:hypothetical protein
MLGSCFSGPRFPAEALAPVATVSSAFIVLACLNAANSRCMQHNNDQPPQAFACRAAAPTRNTQITEPPVGTHSELFLPNFLPRYQR